MIPFLNTIGEIKVRNNSKYLVNYLFFQFSSRFFLRTIYKLTFCCVLFLCLPTAKCLINYSKQAFAKYTRLRPETFFKLQQLISGDFKQLFHRRKTHWPTLQGRFSRSRSRRERSKCQAIQLQCLMTRRCQIFAFYLPKLDLR